MRPIDVAEVAVLSLSFLAISTRAPAQETQSKWGIYVAPTNYRFASGADLEEISSGTSLEFGLFYTKPVSSIIDATIEVRLAERDILSLHDGIGVGLSETFVEFPLLISVGRPIADRNVRITFAAGLSYGVLVSQDASTQPGFSLPSGMTELSFAEYQRIAWIGDAGASLPVDAATSVFARFRLQKDIDTFGESEDVVIAREYVAYGFYAGIDWRF